MTARGFWVFLGGALLASSGAIASPDQGVRTAGGILSIVCRASGEVDEGGKPESSFALMLDGKAFATGSACDPASSKSISAVAIVPDRSGSPQPAIFNDGAFTDLHFEQSNREGTVTLLSVRIERDDIPTVIQWPGLLKPVSISYSGRDTASIRFVLDQSALLPAAGKAAGEISCIGQLSWSDRRVTSFVTDTAHTAADQAHYCEDKFGWLTTPAK